MSTAANRRRTNPSECELSDGVQVTNIADSNEESSEGDSSDYMSDSEVEERDPADGESPHEEQLDDDEDAKNPAFIPRKGMFYEHDSRGDNEPERTVEENDKQKLWKSKEKWGHDRYDERSQAPKSREELIREYGYDIKSKDEPPPEPPQSYQSPHGRRGKASFADFANFSRGGRGRRGGRGNRGSRGGRYQGRGYNTRYNEPSARPGNDEGRREETSRQEMRPSDGSENLHQRREEPKSQDVREDPSLVERLSEKAEAKPTPVSKAKSPAPNSVNPSAGRAANQVAEKKQEPAAPPAHVDAGKAGKPAASEEGRPKRYSKQRQDVAGAGPQQVHYTGPPSKPPTAPQQMYVQQATPLLPPQHFVSGTPPTMSSPVRQPMPGVMPGTPRPPIATVRAPMAPVISQSQPIAATVVNYVGMPTQGIPNQGMPTQGIPNQGMSAQVIPNQVIPAQGIPNQGMPAQGIPNQGMPAQGIPNQGMPAQGIPNQVIPAQGIPNQGMPAQGVPNQVMPAQGIPSQQIPAQVLPNQAIPQQHFAQRPQMPPQQVPAIPTAEPGMKMGGTVYYSSPPPQRPEGTTYYPTPPPEPGTKFYGSPQQASSTPPSTGAFYPKTPAADQQGPVYYNTQAQPASGQTKPRAKNIIAIVDPEASPNKDERALSDSEVTPLTTDESSKDEPIREPVATSHPTAATVTPSVATDSTIAEAQPPVDNVTQQIVDPPSSMQETVLDIKKDDADHQVNEQTTTKVEETPSTEQIQLPEDSVNSLEVSPSQNSSAVVESCGGDTAKEEQNSPASASDTVEAEKEEVKVKGGEIHSAKSEPTHSLMGGGDAQTVTGNKADGEQTENVPNEQGDATPKSEESKC